MLPTAGGDPAVAAADLAAHAGAESLAVEEHHLTVARHRALALGRAAAAAAPISACAVEQQRLVKDEEEIACLRIAAEIADQALGELLESILVGRTERHLALELERRLVDHGADGPAFPTSVATGPNSGRRGHRPTDRRVEEGDFLSVCLGANYRGYRCEIGRTFVIGTTPAGLADRAVRPRFRRSAGRPRGAGAGCRRAATWTARPARSWTPRGTGSGLGPSTGHGVGTRNRRGPAAGPCGHG